MKKTLIIITSLIMICIMLIGCNSTDATITTSKELNKNLNLLMNTVNRLDTIDNDYLVSNDVYSLNTVKASAVPTPNKMYKNVLASNNENNDIINDDNKEFTTLELKADEVSLKDDLTNALKNELVNRLYCDQNGNCKICKQPYTCNNNNMCNNCNQTIICDSNGNCTSCKKQLVLDNNNNCSSCKSSCITTTPNTNISPSTSSCLKRISANNKKLKVDLLATENNDLVLNIDDNNENLNNDIIDDNKIVVDNISRDNVNNSNIQDTNSNINTNNNNYNFSQKPIVIDNANNKNISNSTTSTDTSDNNNNTNNNTSNDDNQDSNKPYRIIYYSESSFMPDILRYNPRFVSQINYDNANSNLNKYVEKLQKLYTMTADVVEANNTLANYKIVILDNIGEAKQLNNCLLDGTCTPTNNQVVALNNYIDDIKSTIRNLRNSNGSLTNEVNKISTNNTGISQSLDVTNSNYLRILNQIDTRISYHENAIATLEQIKFLLQDAQNNNQTVVIENPNNTNQDVIINTPIETTPTDNTIIDTQNNSIANIDDTINNNTSNTNDNIINNDTLNNNNDTIIREDIVEEKIVDNDNDTIIEDKKVYTNVDTYKNNDLSNVNSYLDSKINDDTTLDTIVDEEIINNDNINNDNIDNDTIVNEAQDTNVNDAIINNNNTNNIPQMVDNNSNLIDGNNNIVSNENLVANNNYNNGYDNTIISQNNLDNNNLGNNSYRYDSNGTLYNNTNGYNNTGINNINEKNNNVNTYKYNTLVDSINRGTVNNGINTL